MGHASGDFGGGIAFLIVFYLVYMLIIFGVSIAQYVLRAWGMYSIAKRREIQRPWLAWIPIGDSYLLGSISDQYQYVAKGKVKNKRKALLVLQIVMAVVTVAFFIAYLAVMIPVLLNGDNHLDQALESTVIGAAVYLLVLCQVMMGIGIALTVILYMALYDLYRSCEPGNAALYLVLSIFFSIAMPVFVFICRKKDGGMPPRRDTIPPAEPWEN